VVPTCHTVVVRSGCAGSYVIAGGVDVLPERNRGSTAYPAESARGQDAARASERRAIGLYCPNGCRPGRAGSAPTSSKPNSDTTESRGSTSVCTTVAVISRPERESGRGLGSIVSLATLIEPVGTATRRVRRTCKLWTTRRGIPGRLIGPCRTLARSTRCTAARRRTCGGP